MDLISFLDWINVDNILVIKMEVETVLLFVCVATLIFNIIVVLNDLRVPYG